MKKYKAVKTEDKYNPYVFYKRTFFFFWERVGCFHNIKELLSFINKPPYFIYPPLYKDIEWVCPSPDIKDWEQCNFNLIDYIKLSRYNKKVTDTADRTLVFNETNGQYIIENKPYNFYEGDYQNDYCLPLWSRENLPLLIEELKKVKAKEDQVIRVRSKYFYNRQEYAQWRNVYPKYKILKFNETGFGCYVTYEYKRADGSCEWDDKTETDGYIQWINNIFDKEKREYYLCTQMST